MEPTEIHEFTEQMGEAAEKSMTHVSLIISVLAVLVAMVTVLGHRAHTEAVLQQARATDQWNEYQSHRIRQQTLSATEDLLNLLPAKDTTAVTTKLAELGKQAEKWQTESEEESHKARELEHEVELVERKAARYDVGEALLQISVVLASVTLLTRKSIYVLLALLLGASGLITALSALLIH